MNVSQEPKDGHGEFANSVDNSANGNSLSEFHAISKALVDSKISDTTLRIIASTFALATVVSQTARIEQAAIEKGIALICRMILTRNPIRMIGLGRARLAIALPANRLFHALGDVHIIHGDLPLPNTVRGGYLIVGSASGRTKEVLDIMQTTRRRNSEVRILGLANATAKEFKELCDVFIGLHSDPAIPNPICALADLNEHAISQLLDRMVVIAAHRLGLDDEDMRLGHEDLCTGPYGTIDQIRNEKRQTDSNAAGICNVN